MVLTGTGFTIPVEILSYELSEVMAVLPGSVPDDGPFSRRPGRKAACITCNGRNASTIYGLSPEQEEPVVDLWPATSELLVTERSSTSDVGLWNFWLWKPVSLKSQNRNEYMVGGDGWFLAIHVWQEKFHLIRDSITFRDSLVVSPERE